MNSNNKINKFFIILILVLNIVGIFIITRELFRIAELNKIESSIVENESIINQNKNLINKEDLDTRYEEINKIISSINNLGDLLTFIELKTEEYNLTIEETKVLNVSNEEILYQIKVNGSLESISGFIREIEEDKNIKEIIKSEIEVVENETVVLLLIKNTLL
jgi:hypothetical protein